MCKKIGIILGCLMFMFASGATMAKQPKTELFHCGCEVTDDMTDEASTSLIWKLLNVSHNAKGHLNHMTGDEEECDYSVPIVDEFGDPVLDDQDQPTFDSMSDMYTRDADDCRVSGESGPLAAMLMCGGEVPPVETESCGTFVPPVE